MKLNSMDATQVAKPFLSDVKELRERACEHIEHGTAGSSYIGDVARSMEIR